MTAPVLDCSFAVQTGWTVDGDPIKFGHGEDSLTIDVDIATATMVRIEVDGDASLIDRIEYDCNISDTIMWNWVDSSDTSHQMNTGIEETTNEDLTKHVSITVGGVMDSTIKMFLTYISSYSSTQRVFSNFRVYDANNELLNMEIQMERFELPRDDWYDEDGRIYKDVIIENLNACEAKLLEIQALDAFEIQPPDISSTIYPDVTLSSDEKAIINLRSFCQIMGLANYPLEIDLSARRVNRVTYFDSSYNFNSIVNSDIEGLSDSNTLVYIDTTTNTPKATNSTVTALGGIFIGMYKDGIIYSIHSEGRMNLNLMYLLGNIGRRTGRKEVGKDSSAVMDGNRMVGYGDGESYMGTKSFNFTDYGV